MNDFTPLAAEVRALIASGSPVPDAFFIDLARAIAEAQGRLGDDPGLAGIDPVPEGAFKLMTVAAFPPSEAEAEFHTSGTTTGSPGRLLVRDLDLYRASAVAGFERFVAYPPRPARFASLVPPATEKPHSSLSWMASFAAERFQGALFARSGPDLDLGALATALAAWTAAGEPVILFGTTLDFLSLASAFDAGRIAPVALPAGSRAMHTGGAKGAGREVSRDGLREVLAARLAIAQEDVVEEYGMTELLSQSYDSPRVLPGPRRLVPVRWMRSRVLDPGTLHDVPPGSRGLLCHYDLANVHTAVAVLTGDIATAHEDGYSDVIRAPGAAPRGCSWEAAAGASDVGRRTSGVK